MGAAKGFTLVELVITLLLVTILAVSLIPRTPSRDSLTLEGRAEQLASDLRYAQSLSMTRGQRYCLSFTPTSGPPYSGYRLTTAASGCATDEPHPAGLNQPVNLCESGSCLGATNLPNDYVQFGGLGTPYSTPATELPANAVLTLSGDGGPKTVTISPVTGRVVVQ
jgi:prepilin-type N-terminal cleavage/methylation domain-containing protein